jgi:hypothetical protein
VRHLGSIVLSLILAPVVYVLAGIGVVEAVENASVAPQHDYLKTTLGILALGAAGLLYCLLVMTRISPIGPVLAALLYFAVSVWALFAFASLADLLPEPLFGIRRAAFAPLNGITLLLAVPLLVTIVSPRRWRRSAQPAAPVPAAPVGYPPPPASYHPGYPPPPSYQPNYPVPAQPGQPLDATRPLYPPPMAPPVMSAPPVSPAPADAPVDPDAPTRKFGI